MSETLELVLKKEWYEMIERGEKTEEYREIKDYWIKRLIANTDRCFLGTNKLLVYPLIEFKPYKSVTFRLGYSKTKMEYKIDNIKIGKGNKEWGAPEENVFIISIGEKLS